MKPRKANVFHACSLPDFNVYQCIYWGCAIACAVRINIFSWDFSWNTAANMCSPRFSIMGDICTTAHANIMRFLAQFKEKLQLKFLLLLSQRLIQKFMNQNLTRDLHKIPPQCFCSISVHLCHVLYCRLVFFWKRVQNIVYLRSFFFLSTNYRCVSTSVLFYFRTRFLLPFLKRISSAI